MNTETEKVGEGLTGELAEELEEEHGGDTVGAATVVEATPPSSGLRRWRSSTVSQPNDQALHCTWRRCWGCRRHPTGEAAETPP
jgi:hypothetical protein